MKIFIRKARSNASGYHAYLRNPKRRQFIEKLSDEEFLGKQEFFRCGTDWLNTQRVKFLEYFRFILRALSNTIPKADLEADKDL